MKRVWATLVILALLSGLCVWGSTATKAITTTVAAQLEDAQAAALSGDIQKALLLSEQLAKEWPGHHSLLCTYMPHDRLEAIDQNLAALPKLLSSPDATAQFAAECSRCVAQVKYLNEAELANLQNIL